MINCAFIMGRLIADPELRTTPSGISVTSFCVAVDRSFVKAGEERKADFINVVAWRQTADFVTRYFHKGSMIAVQGSIQTRSYEDKNGNKRTAVEIVADKVSFCGSKSGSNGSFDTQTSNYTQNSQNGELSANSEDFEDDSGLPF